MENAQTAAANGAKRIAVIAIHGVGDHLPTEMAKAASDLLGSRRNASGESRYGAFQETTARIRVSEVTVAPEKSRDFKGRAWGPLDRLRLSLRTSRTQIDSAATSGKKSIDHVFMEGQLQDYKPQGPEDIYECLRTESKRKADGATPEKLVDIYDMFWSDLSGVGQSGLSILNELYQLLFHLGSIGVNNVVAAATFFHGKDTNVARKWDRFSATQKFAAAMLALPVPLINLYLVVVAAGVFMTAAFTGLAEVEQWIVASAVVFVIAAAILGFVRFDNGGQAAFTFRLPLVFALAGTGLASGYFLWAASAHVALPDIEWAQWIIAVIVFLAAGAGAWFLARYYDERRPGALKAFVLISILLTAAAGLSSWHFRPWGDHNQAIAVLLRAGEIGFWGLAIAWFFAWAGILLALWCGRSAVKAVGVSKDLSGEKDRAGRTNWTARLTISLPAMFFLLVTFAGWAGLLYCCLPLLRTGATVDPQTCKVMTDPARCAVDHTIYYRPLIGGSLQPARDWADESFYQAGIGAMPLLLALTALAALIALNAVAPSVADEVSPPSGAEPKDAEALGNWLTAGFQFMRWAGRFIYLGVFLFAPVMLSIVILIQFHRLPQLVDDYVKITRPLTEMLGVLVGGAAVGLLGFGGRLAKLALGLRTGVRVGLDVDNWMRENPVGTNPTTRICARYVSLLRHVLAWKDGDKGYDALVIFAHSQGTVITADLLRFLKVEADARGSYAEYDPSLAGFDRIKTYLFTVGCPLRQLYGLRFPYIYGYAEDTNANIASSPNPHDLGVTIWTNGYRTGDYIGRYIWRQVGPWAPAHRVSPARWNSKNGIPADIAIDPSRAEVAIGPGAHTHYWDHTADQVGEVLDAIIATAV